VTSPEPSNIGDDLGLGLQLPGHGTVDERGRRRLHPISPLVHGASFLPFGIIILFAFGGGAFTRLGLGLVGAALLGGVILAILVAGWQYLVWRNTWYWFDEDGDFRVDSGVLTKQQRRLQLSRLQTVDVTQPLVARLFSMSEVSIEVAGTHDSRVKLRFLTLAEGRALRNAVLARAAGLRADTVEAPEAPITKVPPNELGLSLLMRTTTAMLLLLTVLIVVTSFMTGGWGSVGLALITGGLPVFLVVVEFMRYFDFTVSESPDGLRLHFGLAKRETRTVPPGRVQSIEIVEPLLWRWRSGVRVKVNIAGVGGQDSGGNKEETLLLPVATRDVAIDVIGRVLPGIDLASLDWHPAPSRARRRSPIQGSRLAVAWDDSVFATRRGLVTRRMAVIPHVRTQSVRLTQGPWERVLDLASVHVDTTPGPVHVVGLHLDAATARAVADDEVVRAAAGRRGDRSTRWAADQ
jgi:putative membrane protein